jgi:hypothetical protein
MSPRLTSGHTPPSFGHGIWSCTSDGPSTALCSSESTPEIASREHRRTEEAARILIHAPTPLRRYATQSGCAGDRRAHRQPEVSENPRHQSRLLDVDDDPHPPRALVTFQHVCPKDPLNQSRRRQPPPKSTSLRAGPAVVHRQRLNVIRFGGSNYLRS